MTGYLLDTNVISELVKRSPDEKVSNWSRAADEDTLYLSVLSFGEIRRGVERLPPGARRLNLVRWLEIDLTERFEGRILGIDRATAETWGSIMARTERASVRLPAVDSLIAATAEQHGLVVATRNIRDFAAAGVAVFNPWD